MHINMMMTDLEIQQALYAAVDKDPQMVLKCDAEKNPHVKKELFVLNILDRKLISFSNGSYFDGGKYLGTTVDQVLETFEKDELLMAKFGKLLQGAETPIEKKKPNGVKPEAKS